MVAAQKTRPAWRIGPAGWSYADWRGRVYPDPIPRRFDALGWIARFFATVEINASFYRIPPPTHSESWVRRVAHRDDFRFAVKLHRSFTHDAREIDPEALAAFTRFLTPLGSAGRLGPVLIQFPWSFRPQPRHQRYLERLVSAVAVPQLVLELRHTDWESSAAREFVEGLGVVVASIDQPALPQNLGPRLRSRDGLVYVRLHGRNARQWFDSGAGRDARYDYMYSQDELETWTQPLEEWSRSGPAEEAYIITNNHYEGQAVANALQTQAMLGLPVPEYPAALGRMFPSLAEGLRAQGSRAVEWDENVPGSSAAQTRLFE